MTTAAIPHSLWQDLQARRTTQAEIATRYSVSRQAVGQAYRRWQAQHNDGPAVAPTPPPAPSIPTAPAIPAATFADPDVRVPVDVENIARAAYLGLLAEAHGALVRGGNGPSALKALAGVVEIATTGLERMGMLEIDKPDETTRMTIEVMSAEQEAALQEALEGEFQRRGFASTDDDDDMPADDIDETDGEQPGEPVPPADTAEPVPCAVDLADFTTRLDGLRHRLGAHVLRTLAVGAGIAVGRGSDPAVLAQRIAAACQTDAAVLARVVAEVDRL